MYFPVFSFRILTAIEIICRYLQPEKKFDNQMAKKKKKQQGHYCRICGDYKANEKFSGKGHARHICKSCMSAMRSGKNPEDIFPEPLPVNRETIRFNKLGKEEKAVLKAFITEATTEYWQENRQIPFADSFSELKKYIIGTYDEECGILLKDDAELKTTFRPIR